MTDRESKRPKQQRSRETLERIVAAAERLLEDTPFERISVAEIVSEAGSTVGSFYARFPSKESLLPVIYERYDGLLRAEIDAFLASTARAELTLREVCRRSVAQIARMFRDRKWLMRAMALHARTHPAAVGTEPRLHRQQLHRRWGDVFLSCSPEIRHPSPEIAVHLGLFMVVATCRDKILFGDSPHSAAVRIGDKRLVTELSRALYAYLTLSDAENTPRRSK